MELKEPTEVRTWTSARTLVGDGNFFQMIWKRVKRELARTSEYFTKNKKGYDMQDKNLHQ
jgi:hypothetical protein